VWRHGQTEFNATRRFQGKLNIPLNATGREQAARAARYLAAFRPDAIYSSDLARAAQTAAALARLTSLPVTLDADLRERGGGSWEGLTNDQIREQFPDTCDSWIPPDGEPAPDVVARMAAALTRVADATPAGGLSVVVAHGACLGMGIARLIGVSYEARLLGPFGNCRWSVLTRRGGAWRLLEHNVGGLPESVPDLDADVAVEAEPAGGAAGLPEGRVRGGAGEPGASRTEVFAPGGGVRRGD
jgi:broad specificity phosphatase PhoE